MQVNHFHLYWPWTSFMSFLPQQFFPVLEATETKYQHRVNATCDFNHKTKALGQTRAETGRWKHRVLWLMRKKRDECRECGLWGQAAYPGQFIDDALLLQDLQLQKGYFLLIVRLIQVIQRLELLQRRMRADLLPLQQHPQRNGTTASAGGPRTTKTHGWLKPDSVPPPSQGSPLPGPWVSPPSSG